MRFTYGTEYVNTSMLSAQEETSVRDYLDQSHVQYGRSASCSRTKTISEERLGHDNLKLCNFKGTLLPTKLKDRLPSFINRQKGDKAQQYFYHCKKKLFEVANTHRMGP